MGLFSNIVGEANKYAGKVYRPVVKPVTKPLFKKVIKPAFNDYVGFQNYMGADIRAHVEHPELFNPALSKEDKRRILARYGLENSFAFAGKAITDSSTRKQVEEKGFSGLPGYGKFGYQMAGDPLTWLSGSAVLRQGLKGGVRAALKEALMQTGVPSVAKLPYSMTVGAAKGRRIAELTRMRTLIDVTAEASKDSKAAQIAGLDDAARTLLQQDASDLKALINESIDASTGQGAFTPKSLAARVRLSLTMPNIKTRREQFGALAEITAKLTGDNLTKADVLKEARSGKFLTTVGNMVGWQQEFHSKYIHQLDEAKGIEKLAMKVPGVNRVLSGLKPAIRAQLELDPAFDVLVRRGASLNNVDQMADTLGSYTALKARGVGMIGDPVSGVVKGVRARGDIAPTLENVLTQPHQFHLNKKQAIFVEGFQKAKHEIVSTALTAIENATDIPQAARNDLISRLTQMKSRSYVPRVGTWVAKNEQELSAFKQGLERPGILKRIAAKVHIPTPIGDIRLPVQRIRGTAIPSSFERLPVVRRGVGSKQSILFDRVLDSPEEAKRVLFSHDPGEVISAFSREVNTLVTDEVLTKPLLRGMGKTAREIIAGRFDVELAQGYKALDKFGKTRAILHSIANGSNVSKKTVARLKALRSDTDLPEEARIALDSVIAQAEAHFTHTEAVGKAGQKISKELGKAGRALETTEETMTGAAPGIRGQELAAQYSGEGLQAPPTLAEYQRGLADIEQSRTLNPLTGKPTMSPEELNKPVHTAIQQYMERTGKTIEELVDDIASGVPADLAAKPQTLIGDAATLRNNLITEARVRRDEIDHWFNITKGEYADTRKEKAAVLRASTLFDMRQTKVPGVAGHWFDKEIADHIDQYFTAQSKDELLKNLAGLQGVAQSMMAGFDGSVTFMQSLAALPANPVGWVKAFAYGLASVADEKVYWRYLEGINNSVDIASGRTWGEQITRSRLSLSGTELFAPTEMLQAIGIAGGKLDSAAGFITRAPLNRMFAVQRNVASIELLRSQVALESAIAGRALNDDELQAVGRQADLATGVMSSTKLGIQPKQATYERLFGRFGVQWFRSQTGRLVTAVSSGGIDGRVARRLLFHQLAAMTSLYVATAQGLGQTPILDPTHRDFGTLYIGKSRVRFGGIYPSVMKTVAQTVDAVASGNEEKLLDIKNGRNPILNFWRNGAPVIGGLIADNVAQVNANTQYGASNISETFGLSGVEATAANAIGRVLPFDVQAALDPNIQDASLLDRALAGGATGLGLTQSPQTATDIWKAVSDQYAKERGVSAWDDLPKAEQEKAKNDHEELKQADANRQAWFDKHGGSPLSTAIDESDKSRTAMGDVLSGLWTRVQSGQMDKAEWRQVYADWAGRHSYLAENIFGSLPEKDRATLDKDPKLAQDRLASKFQAIQPTDVGGDGQIDEADWKEWRAARKQFWVDNPEAQKYSQYIQFDYPNRIWERLDNPIMKQADMERRQAADSYDEYVSIPKYKSLSTTEGDFLDQLISAKAAASKEIAAILAQRGADPQKIRVPAEAAWKYALAQLQQNGVTFGGNRAQIVKLAIAVARDDKARLKLLSSARLSFLKNNPQVKEWYPSALRDTGLPDTYLVRLGLINEPSGLTVAERAAQMVNR